MSRALFHALEDEFGVQREARRADCKTADSILSSLFPKQKQLLEDPSARKAVVCPRRAGKSWSALSYCYHTSLTKPRSNCIIVGLTLKSLKSIYWTKVLPEYEATYGIQSRKHHTEMRVFFSNGSVITWAGAETKAEIEKLRGQAYDLVVIDEAASFAPNVLDELVNDVFRPALSDRRGTLAMIGTPGNSCEGLFFQGTFPGAHDDSKESVPYARTFDAPESYWKNPPENVSPRWSRHSWTVKENTSLPHLWSDALKEKRDNGWEDNHPTWLREYLGEWVSSSDVFVYAYRGVLEIRPETVQWSPARSRENKSGLPSGNDYRYIIGVDLGFEDDFALVVGAYSLTDGSLYHVDDLKLPHQDVTQVARHIQDAVDRCDSKVDAIVADNAGLGKMVIETINRTHGMNIVPADKREKNDFIELLNADFHSGKIKVLRDSDLEHELMVLQWDVRKHTKAELVKAARLKENPNHPNHLCDALLYCWRYSYHTFGKPAPSRHEVNSAEYFEQWERDNIAAMVAKHDRINSNNAEYKGLPAVDPLKDYYGPRYRSG